MHVKLAIYEKKARIVTFVISMEGGIQTIPDQRCCRTHRSLFFRWISQSGSH